nr:transcription elongation factor, TFIIS/CRSP70 [Tanacetum cinerariifolium]
MRDKIVEMLFSCELINYCGGGDMSFKKKSMKVSCEVQDEMTDKVLRIKAILDKSKIDDESKNSRAQVKSAEDNASKGPLNPEQKVADKSYGDEYELVVYNSEDQFDKTIVPKVPRVTPHQQCKSANPELAPRVAPDQQSKSRIISKVAANNQKGPRVTLDQQFKSPMNSKEATNTKSGQTNTSFQEKLVATKRKFQQHYMEEENLKKKRRIQVMELHEVIKKVRIPQKDQQERMRRIYEDGDVLHILHDEIGKGMSILYQLVFAYDANNSANITFVLRPTEDVLSVVGLIPILMRILHSS